MTQHGQRIVALAFHHGNPGMVEMSADCRNRIGVLHLKPRLPSSTCRPIGSSIGWRIICEKRGPIDGITAHIRRAPA
jgi:hypothetical protein